MDTTTRTHAGGVLATLFWLGNIFSKKTIITTNFIYFDFFFFLYWTFCYLYFYVASKFYLFILHHFEDCLEQHNTFVIEDVLTPKIEHLYVKT